MSYQPPLPRPVTCVECGKLDNAANFLKSKADAMVARSLCFTCLFWTEILEGLTNEPTAFRAKGQHWQIGDENAPRGSSYRGCGGAPFLVTFTDGRPPRRTTNLWHQGDIPERFRERMPDNAILQGL